MSTNVGDLVLSLRLDKSTFDRDIKELTRVTRSPIEFDVKVNVDDRSLYQLNDHFDVKARHHKALQQQFDNNPLKPKVDTSELVRLEMLYRGIGSAGSIEVIHKLEPSNPQSQSQDFNNALSSNLKPVTDLLKQIENNTRKPGLIGKAVGAVAEGALFGTSQAAVKNFGEGISRGLERYFKTDFGRRGQALGLGTGRNVRRAGGIADLASRELLGMPNGLKDIKRLAAGNTQRIYDNLTDPQFYKDIENLYVEMARLGFNPSDLLMNQGELQKNPRIKSELDKFSDRFEEYIEDYVARLLGAGLRLGTQPLRIRKRIALEDSAQTALETADVYQQQYNDPAEKERIAKTKGTIYVVGGGQPTESKPGEPNVQSTYDLANQVQAVFPEAYVKASAPVNANSLESLESSPSIQLKNFILANQDAAKDLLGNFLSKEEIDQLMGSLKNPHPFDRMAQTNIQGFDEDAIKTAAEIIGEIKQNIKDGVQRDITVVGGSLGGQVVENVIGILNHVAKLEPELAPHIARVRGEGQGTPITGYTATAHSEHGKAKFHATIGDLDHVGVAYYGEDFINPNATPEQREQILQEVPFGLPNQVVAPHPDMQTVIPNFGFLHQIGDMTPQLGNANHPSGQHFLEFINSRNGNGQELFNSARNSQLAINRIRKAQGSDDISSEIDEIVFALAEFNIDASDLYQYKTRSDIPDAVVNNLATELSNLKKFFSELTGIGKPATATTGGKAKDFHGTLNHISSAIASIAQGKMPEGIYSPIDSELIDFSQLEQAANSSPENISLYGGEPEALVRLWKDAKANFFRALGENFNQEWSDLVSLFDRMAEQGYEEHFNAKPFQHIVDEPFEDGPKKAKFKASVSDRFSREDIPSEEVYPRIADFLYKTTGITKDDDLPTILKKYESAEFGDSQIEQLARQAVETFISIKKKEAQYYIDYAKRMVGFKEALANNPQDEDALRGIISELVNSPFSHFKQQLRNTQEIAKLPEGVSAEDYLFDYLTGKPVEPMTPGIPKKVQKQIGDVDTTASVNFISQSLFTSLVAQIHGLEAAVEMAKNVFENFGHATKDSRMAKRQVLGAGLEPSLESNPFAIRSLVKLKQLAKEKGLDFADFDINQARVLGKGYTGEAIELQDKGLVVKRATTNFATENDKIGNKTEIAAMNAIADKNIAPKPVGKVDDMFVMTAVPGKSLRSQLDNFDTNKVDELLRRVGAMLAAIHGSGYAHNDFNTANILYDAQSDRLSVIDFPNAKKIENQGDIDADFSTAISRSTQGASEYVAKNYEKLVRQGYENAQDIEINPQTQTASFQQYQAPAPPFISELTDKQRQQAEAKARAIWESKGSPEQNPIDSKIDYAQAVLETLTGSFDPVATDNMARKIWESKGSPEQDYSSQRQDYLAAISQQIKEATRSDSPKAAKSQDTVDVSQIYQKLEAILSVLEKAESSPGSTFDSEELNYIVATSGATLDPFQPESVPVRKAENDRGNSKYEPKLEIDENPFLGNQTRLSSESDSPGEIISRIDRIIELLSGGDGGGGTGKAETPDPNTPIPELVHVAEEVTSKAKMKAELARPQEKAIDAQTIKENTLATVKNTVKSLISGVIENFDRLGAEAQKWEKAFLDLAPGQLGHIAKRATQYTAMPIAATFAAQGIPGFEQAIGAIHGLADLGLHDLAQGLADGLMDSISRSMPDAFGSIMDSLSNAPVIGDYFGQMRQIPGQVVHSASEYIVGNSGRTLADIATGSAVIKGGQDAYNAIGNAANPNRALEQERRENQAILDRVQDHLSVTYKKKPLTPDSQEITAELENLKLEQAFDKLANNADETASKLHKMFTRDGLRTLAPMVGISTSELPKTKGNNSEMFMARYIAENASDADINTAIASASKDMLTKDYRHLSADKPKVSREELDYIKSIYAQNFGSIKNKQINSENIDTYLADLEKARNGYRELLLNKQLDGKQRTELAGYHSEGRELERALLAKKQFANPEDLGAKFGDGATKADKHWGNTTKDILKNFRILAAEAKEKGYDIQKALSKGSPGMLTNLEGHWLKTTNTLKAQIQYIRDQSQIAGTDIQEAFAANPDLAENLDKIERRLDRFQDTLRNDYQLEVAAEMPDVETAVEDTLSAIADSLSDIELGGNVSIDADAATEGFTTLRDVLREIHVQTLDTGALWREIMRIITAGAASLPDDEDPLGGLNNVREGYDNLVENLPNSGDVFGGIKDFVDQMSERSQVFADIVDFGMNVGVSAAGILSFEFLAENIGEVTQMLLEQGMELQRFTLVMDAAGRKGEKLFDDIYNKSQDMGLVLRESYEGYERFFLSTQGLGNEAIVDPVFSGFQKAFASKMASGVAQQRGYLALEQMISKGGVDGSVSSEELRLQLSEALPGAMAVAAKVRGQSTKELQRDLRAANVEASDLLVRMAAFYETESEIMLGIRADTFEAELTRLQNKIEYFQKKTGEDLLPFGKAGLQVANTGLSLLENNLSTVATIAGGVFLMAMGRMTTSMYQVTKATKLGTVAMKTFGIESLVRYRRMYGNRALAFRGVKSIASLGKTIAPALIAMKTLEKLYGEFTAGDADLKEAAKIASKYEDRRIKLGQREDSEQNQGSLLRRSVSGLNEYGNPWDYEIDARENNSKKISKLLEDIDRESGQVSLNIATDDFTEASEKFQELENEIATVTGRKIRLMDDKDFEGVAEADAQLKELRKTQKEVAEELTRDLSSSNSMLKSIELAEKKLEDLRPYLGGGWIGKIFGFDSEENYQGVAKFLARVKEKVINNIKGLENAIKAPSSAADDAIENADIIVNDANYVFDIEVSQSSIDLIDQKLSGLISGRELELETNLSQLNAQRKKAESYTQAREELEQDLLNEPRLDAIKEALGVEDNDKVFHRIRIEDTTESALIEQLQNTSSFSAAIIRDDEDATTDIAQIASLVIRYQEAYQQEKQEQGSYAESRNSFNSLVKDQGLSIREFGNELREFARSLEDFQLEKERFEVDFPLEVEDAARNLDRSARDLKEQYDDLILSLDKEIAQTSLEIAQIEKEIAGSKSRAELTRSFSGNTGIGREIAELYNDYLNNLQTDEELQLQQNLTRLEIEEQTTQTSRQIRGLAEQREDLERDRFQQQLQLQRRQEDFNRQQKLTFEDTLDKWYNIELQSKELGVALDLTAEQIAQQGTGLIEALHELAKKIKFQGENFVNSRNTNANESDIINALRRAIIGKESNGNFRAVNPDSGALGYGQVMPFNVASWTKQALGRSLTPNEFLNDSLAQIEVINHKLNEYYTKELRKTAGDRDLALRRVASTWYSGQPDLYNNTAPQRYGNGDYPSINDYTADVLKRTLKELPQESITASTKNDSINPIVTNANNSITTVTKPTALPPVQNISANYEPATEKANESRELRDRKLELTPEEQEARRLEELANVVDRAKGLFKQLDDQIRQTKRSTADSILEIDKLEANTKGYLTSEEEIKFAGADVEASYFDKIQSFEDQKRKLKEEYQLLISSTIPELQRAVEAGIEDAPQKLAEAVEAAEVFKQLYNEQDVLQIRAELNLDVDKDRTELEKGFEIDIQRREDDLSIQQEIFDARQDSNSLFTFGKEGIRATERNLGIEEIQIDYKKRLKDLEQYKNEEGELTEEYIRRRQALEELTAIKFDNLIEQTSTWGNTIRESVTAGVDGAVEYFTDNLIGGVGECVMFLMQVSTKNQ